MADKTGRALQRPPAELTYADELARLAKSDDAPKPPGWKLSARAVRTFILGDETPGDGSRGSAGGGTRDERKKVRQKFVGNPSLVDRAMVAPAS